MVTHFPPLWAAWVWPGKFLAPLKPCAEDLSCPPQPLLPAPLSGSTSAPLPFRVSRGTALITHNTLEKQTQEGLGEWDLGKGQKLGHVTEEAAAQAESRTSQRRKAVTLGTLGDSEQSPFVEGLVLPVTPLWPGLMFFQILLCICFFLGGWLRLPRPLQSSMLILLASTYPGLFPSTDTCPSRDQLKCSPQGPHWDREVFRPTQVSDSAAPHPPELTCKP